MKNHEKFKQIYDEVHAPEGLYGKVMDLYMKKKEFKTRNLVKVAVCALAVTLGLFGAGNGICYAATGETLMTKMKVIINGEETQQEVNWSRNGDAYHGEVVIPNEDGSSVTIFTVSDELPENMDVVMDITQDGKENEDGITTEDTVEISVLENETVEEVGIKKEDAVP